MTPLSIQPVSIERGIKLFCIGLLVLFFISYTYFQAQNLILGPSISVDTALETISTERVISLSGTVRNVVVLRLNGKEIHTDESGRFTHTLMLENGYTIMHLEARDRYGRQTDFTRSFVYKPQA